MEQQKLTIGIWLIASLFSAIYGDRGPVDFYDCTGKLDGNYQHPSDCQRFMSCVGQLYAYERDCPAGLNYDASNDRCDWPSQVGCIIDSPPTTTTTEEPTTTTEEPTTTTEEPTTTTEEPTTTTTTEPPIFDCSGLEDGNYPHPEECTKFVSCVAGKYLYIRDCPADLHYDPRSDRCEYPWLAGCDSSLTTTTEEPTTTTEEPTTTTEEPTTTTEEPTTTTTTEPPIFDCYGLEDGNYPHPEECTKFVSCVAGKYLYIRDCPADLHYDPRSDRCEYPWLAGCDSSLTTTTEEPTTTTEEPTTTTTTTTEEPTTTTTTEPPIFDCSGLEDGNYPHPEECTKFVSCVAGKYLYIRDCPADLHYDPRSDRCEYQWLAGCDSSLTTTTEEPTTTEAITTTSEPTTTDVPETTSPKQDQLSCTGRADGNYPHPNCNKFISCVAGQYLYEMDCPAGLQYDARTDRCDYAEIVGCSSSN
ncbi:unnamed protein product [Orchesella dallaii]|uniref:Chitin-binding type-2 domain-containing protein n=1 Tax=Orchesella dallaii TaxID=48710 RepID=A0ABP1RRK3_9HEXA